MGHKTGARGSCVFLRQSASYHEYACARDSVCLAQFLKAWVQIQAYHMYGVQVTFLASHWETPFTACFDANNFAVNQRGGNLTMTNATTTSTAVALQPLYIYYTYNVL